MIVLVVRLQIKPEYRQQFIDAVLADARGSIENEPGCIQFNVVQDNQDPNRLYLFEAYRDQDALEAHRQMPHLKKYRETVKDWHAEPPQIAQCRGIYPPNEAWKKQV